MLDYVAWIGRAKAFLRQLPALPGHIEVYDSIESPVSSDYELELFASPRCPLPETIRCFLRTASKRCAISYSWTPPGNFLRATDPPPTYTAFGDLCEYNRYSLAFREDDAEGSPEPSCEDMFGKLDGQLPDWLVQSMRTSAANSVASNTTVWASPDEGYVSLLVPHQSEDRVVIRIIEDNDYGKVFYWSPSFRDTPIFLSESFDAFLLSWERMLYAEISARTIRELVNGSRGRLNEDATSIRTLKSLLEQAFAARSTHWPAVRASAHTFDYAQWLVRAEVFVRGLTYLPDEFGVTIDSQPPLHESEVDKIARDLRVGLPEPLRELYLAATGGCTFRYSWKPWEARLPLLREVFEYDYGLYGGVSFTSPADLAEDEQACVHTPWADDETASLDLVEVWRNALPFCRIGNGDYLAFDRRSNNTDPPIIYLCHDMPEISRVSPSFQRFLTDWESICYIGPENWMLAPWLDDEQGCLRLADAKTQHINRLLRNPI